ncbi:MAG: hypothetical protein ABEJ42_07810 [Halobacteriaceae archaeon]
MTAARYRRVAAVHLGLAGLVSLALGLALVVLGSAGELVRPAFALAGRYVSAQTLLRDAPTYAWLATRVAPVVGGALAVTGAGALLAVRGTLRDAGVRRPVAAALLVAWNPLALPLAAIAVALLLLDPAR